MRFGKYFCSALLLVFVFISLSTGCGETVDPSQCSGDVGDSTLGVSPNGNTCTKKCECNNQQYTGDCLVGKCVSIKRDSCLIRKTVRNCTHHILKCEGTQKCGADYLVFDKYADCECKK